MTYSYTFGRKSDNSGNDYIKGTSTNNALIGGNGNDELYGLGGDDKLFGDNGMDWLDGGKGNDQLYGGNGNDTLFGGAGKDVLTGGYGTDDLFGGAGGDIFVFNQIADSRPGSGIRDNVVDFSHAQHDKIDLGGIDANTKASGDQAFHFIGTKAFHGHAGELRYDYRGHDGSILYGDVNGDGKADFSFFLDNGTKLVGSDFFL